MTHYPDFREISTGQARIDALDYAYREGRSAWGQTDDAKVASLNRACAEGRRTGAVNPSEAWCDGYLDAKSQCERFGR